MRDNTAKRKLATGQAVSVINPTYSSPGLVELLGRMGFDVIFLDCEHGPASWDAVEDMVRAAELVGATPIVRVQANERTVARYEIAGGFLAVVSRIPIEIFDGTRKLGVSNGGHILLSPGQYKLRLVNTQYGYRDEAEFTIKAGEVSTHTVALPEGSLHVTTDAGAEVLVDGKLMGVAPLAAFRVPIGAREVLVRHAELGERRQSVDVVQGQPVELSVIFKEAAPPTPARSPSAHTCRSPRSRGSRRSAAAPPRCPARSPRAVPRPRRRRPRSRGRAEW